MKLNVTMIIVHRNIMKCAFLHFNMWWSKKKKKKNERRNEKKECTHTSSQRIISYLDARKHHLIIWERNTEHLSNIHKTQFTHTKQNVQMCVYIEQKILFNSTFYFFVFPLHGMSFTHSKQSQCSYRRFLLLEPKKRNELYKSPQLNTGEYKHRLISRNWNIRWKTELLVTLQVLLFPHARTHTHSQSYQFEAT